MSFTPVRWFVRGGGPWWFRWGVRLAFLAAIVAIMFIPYSFQVSGDCRVVSPTELSIRAQITDELQSIDVEEGRLVKPGEVIATLAAREEKAQVDVLKASLKKAQADLDLLKAGNRPEEIDMAQQKLELWQVQLAYQKTNLERSQKLHETKSMAKADLDKAQKMHDISVNMVESAQDNLSKVKKGARDEQIRSAEAQVESTAAQLAQAEVMYALRYIRSPIAGRIETPKIQLKRGQMVQPGDLVAVVTDVRPPLVEVIADEAAAQTIKPGMRVKIRLRSRYGELLTGTVSKIGLVAEEEGDVKSSAFRSDKENTMDQPKGSDTYRYVRVYVDLDEYNSNLLPNMTGYAKIVVEDGNLFMAFYRPVVRFFKVEVWSWFP